MCVECPLAASWPDMPFNVRARKLATPRMRVASCIAVAERVVLSVLAPTRASGITAL